MGPIRNCVANFFEVANSFSSTLEGVDKAAGVLQPAVALAHMQFGDVIPISIYNILEDLKGAKAIKNATFWVFNVKELFEKPFSLKDFNALGRLVNCAKRLCFIAASVLMLGEYLDRIQKVAAPVGAFPWKMVLLLSGVILSAIKGCIDLQDNSKKQAKLIHERRFYVVDPATLSANEIADRENELRGEINELKDYMRDTFAKGVTHDLVQVRARIVDLERQAKESRNEDKQIKEALVREKKVETALKAKKTLEKIIAYAPRHFLDLEIQKEQLELFKSEKENEKDLREVLNDVKILGRTGSKNYYNHKIEVFNVREANLTTERKKAWHGILFDISKVFVFSIILVKAPLLSLVPARLMDTAKKTIEGISLISGLLGARKFTFEAFNKLKSLPRPLLTA